MTRRELRPPEQQAGATGMSTADPAAGSGAATPEPKPPTEQIITGEGQAPAESVTAAPPATEAPVTEASAAAPPAETAVQTAPSDGERIPLPPAAPPRPAMTPEMLLRRTRFLDRALVALLLVFALLV